MLEVLRKGEAQVSRTFTTPRTVSLRLRNLDCTAEYEIGKAEPDCGYPQPYAYVSSVTVDDTGEDILDDLLPAELAEVEARCLAASEPAQD